ncbi:hypothetical protein QE152_g139 [Popillia japonica]|uniref:Uncharacterized protein n=1 Tax=Popillia japonica TaxID=7064 RepID=A0AAW1NLI0_POPJA
MFSQFIAKSWNETPTSVIVQGFKKSRIMPFNNFVVSRDKFDINALKRWKEKSVCQQPTRDLPDVAGSSTSTLEESNAVQSSNEANEE